MKKLLINFRMLCALAVGIFTLNTALACDRSSLTLNSFSAIGGGQYQINMTFTVGAGSSSTAYGADQNTGDYGFFISGATFASYPATMVSPNTGATFTPNTSYADTILVYENVSQWWACIDGGCGPIQTVSKSITIVTQGLPSNIVLLGMEGGGTIFGCDGPDMTIDFTCSSLTASAGPDKEVFPAYFPNACTQLIATAANGSGSYSYLWSNGATTSTINICPSASSVYTVTITDLVYGCTKVDQASVTVTNITCGNNKIIVCQNGVQRCVPKSQVAGILAGGGTLGTCKNKASAFVEESIETGLQVAPNPAHGSAKVLLSVANAGEVSLNLYDINGRQVKTLLNESREAGAHEVVMDLEGLSPGLYIARMSVGGEGYSTKVMVQ